MISYYFTGVIFFYVYVCAQNMDFRSSASHKTMLNIVKYHIVI